MGAIEPRPEQRPNPFLSNPSDRPEPTEKPWSFSQPVLLKKTNRNRNVLVWSLVGSVAFAHVASRSDRRAATSAAWARAPAEQRSTSSSLSSLPRSAGEGGNRGYGGYGGNDGNGGNGGNGDNGGICGNGGNKGDGVNGRLRSRSAHY